MLSLTAVIIIAFIVFFVYHYCYYSYYIIKLYHYHIITLLHTLLLLRIIAIIIIINIIVTIISIIISKINFIFAPRLYLIIIIIISTHHIIIIYIIYILSSQYQHYSSCEGYFVRKLVLVRRLQNQILSPLSPVLPSSLSISVFFHNCCYLSFWSFSHVFASSVCIFVMCLKIFTSIV